MTTSWIILSLLAASPANGDPDGPSALNCADEPVPPTYENLPCMIVVNRAEDTSIHIDYELDPAEINVLVEDQTIQLYAFPIKPVQLPGWLTREDWDAAKAQFEGDENCDLPDEPAPNDILETHEDLKDNYWVLTEPSPVTVEQAALGFDIDTADLPGGGSLPAGNYFVYAFSSPVRFYPFHAMPAGLRVVDGEGSEAVPPGVFLLPLETDANDLYVTLKEYRLEGCVVGSAGTQFDVEWRPDPGEWQSLAECLPAADPFEVPFIMPSSVFLTPLWFRVTAENPDGMVTELISDVVSWGPDGAVCIDPEVTGKPPYCDGFVEGDPSTFPDLFLCEDGEDSGTDDEDGTGVDTDPDPDDSGEDDEDSDDADPKEEDEGGGCTCTANNHPMGYVGLWLMCLAVGVGRRRRQAAARVGPA